MKRKNFIGFISALFILLSGCSNDDIFLASFSLSDEEPKTGRPVTFTADNSEMKRYEWYIDGSHAGSERSLQYVFTTTGTHMVKLEVYKRKKLTATSERSVNVISEGSAVFWRSSVNYTEPLVVMVNMNGGGINAGLLSAPSCGDVNCANYNLESGNYSYTVNNQTFTQSWNGNFTVTENGCTVIEIN